MAKNEEKKDEQEELSVKEAYQKKLLAALTPAGERFVEKLDKALADEFAQLCCAAADMIRNHIEEHHLKSMDSVKAINSLAEQRAKARVTCYYLIMNHAGLLLMSGRAHRRQGVLSDDGDMLLQIWTIYAYRLAELGELSFEQIESEQSKLRTAIQHAGRRPTFTVVGAVKSLFSKNKR